MFPFFLISIKLLTETLYSTIHWYCTLYTDIIQMSVLTVAEKGEPGTQEAANQIITHFKPALCSVLISQVCGEAPQSTLETITRVLIKLNMAKPGASTSSLMKESLQQINAPQKPAEEFIAKFKRYVFASPFLCHFTFWDIFLLYCTFLTRSQKKNICL
jgi:hypothetical protein